jgi:phosphotransferase system  glucose/maltose/N-acetylglucosamine-specific IIC component
MEVSGGAPISTPDARTAALTDLAVAVASGSQESEYLRIRDDFNAFGVPASEALGTFFAIASTVGSARVVAAARGIAIVIGYDVDADLEGLS